MSTATLTRIDRLELAFGGGVRGPFPADGAVATTGEQIGESRAAECPRCGRSPQATVEIVGMDVDELP